MNLFQIFIHLHFIISTSNSPKPFPCIGKLDSQTFHQPYTINCSSPSPPSPNPYTNKTSPTGNYLRHFLYQIFQSSSRRKTVSVSEPFATGRLKVFEKYLSPPSPKFVFLLISKSLSTENQHESTEKKMFQDCKSS